MSGFISEDQVRRVKELVDLVQLMGEYTTMRKSGANFSACCPFHQERTPSMYVYPAQGSYHCFGCGAHGDAISLIRDKERLEFADAIEFLARRVGVTIEYKEGTGRGALAKGERDHLQQAMEQATRFYERILWDSEHGAEARAYLAGRGLSPEVCRRFRVGWAPGNGLLLDELRRLDIPASLAARLDLAVERSGRLTDRFFTRVTFPICDRFGHPIAFSARLLPAAERAAKEAGRGVGKYVNSTDTPLYHKGDAVFNLHRARTAGSDRKRLIVMEGPTDVMAADQAGLGECVAVLGTALTPEHARQLGSLTTGSGKLFLVLDGDRAGQVNALKGIRTCLSVGVPVRVATIPDDMDPAEMLVELDGGGGRERFEAVLAQGRGDVEHLLRVLAPRPYELERSAMVAVADQVLDALRSMPDPELRALHLRDVAAWFNVEADRLERRLSAAPRPPPAPFESAEAAPPAEVLPTLDPVQDVVLHLLVARPELRAHAADDLGLEPSHFPSPWSALVMELIAHPDADPELLRQLDEVGSRPGVAAALAHWAGTPLEARTPSIVDAAGTLAQGVASLRRRQREERLARLRRECSEAERVRDAALVATLRTQITLARQALNPE